MVKDILAATASSSPGSIAVMGDVAYFAADDGIHGRELWKSDGTEAGTQIVKDIQAGSDSSSPSNLTPFDGTLFFSTTTQDQASGWPISSIWRTDGSSSGTTLLGTFSAALPIEFFPADGALFFVVSTIVGGRLGKTDGTYGGTTIVHDTLNVGSGVTIVSNTLFFSASTSGTGSELWTSDGTAAGTALVKDIRPGTNGSSPVNLTNVGGTLFFTANDGTSGVELWKSDGTATGTTLVKDIRPGTNGSSPANLTNVGGALLFAANDGTTGVELWKSDGTAAGTTLVKDIRPGTNGSSPANLTNVGGALLFAANDGTTGVELWQSDGTSAGTSRLKDISSGTASSSPADLINIGGMLYFSAHDGTTGVELWQSDGTTGGTLLVTDISSGSSSPTSITNFNGHLLFAASTQFAGSELWFSDGSTHGTVLVRDINTQVANGGSSPSRLLAVGNQVFFVANDSIHGAELWKSDGTEGGTILVRDIRPGQQGSAPTSLTNVNGTLYFVADDETAGIELWKSDGSVEGTVRVTDITPGSASSTLDLLTNVNEYLFFLVNETALWKSDGTPDGTVLVANFPKQLSFSPPSVESLTNVSGTLFFSAVSATTNSELWKSDGSSAGTELVRDIRSGGSGSAPANLTNVGGTLFFTANDGTTGVELWMSDGTAAGTTLVKDIFAGTTGSSPANLTNVGGTLYFRANDGTSGVELWKSDGTAGGTTLVKDIFPGTNGSSPAFLTNVGGTLYFSAADGTTGLELWMSDGTANGTHLVKNIAAGSSSSSPTSLTEVNGQLFFTATDGLLGAELWTSDGTEDNTIRVADILPSGSSSPAWLTSANGRLFFTADNGVHGRELWVTYDSNAPVPDLAVRDLVISSVVGHQAQVTWRVYNDGEVDATGTWQDRIYLTSDPINLNGPTVDLPFSGTIPGGGWITRSVTIDLPTMSLTNRHVAVVVDHADTVRERDETNNRAAVPLLLSDLVVRDLVVTTSGVFGQAIDIAWTTRNEGNLASSASWTERIYLSSFPDSLAGAVLLATVDVPDQAISSGEDITHSLTRLLPLTSQLNTGTYYVVVVTDSGDTVAELDESNNLLSVVQAISLPPLPDLIISNITSPLEVISGQTVPISWIVTNQGSAPAVGTWIDRLFLSTDNFVGGDAMVGSFAFAGTLAPGESIVRTQNITFPVDMQGQRWVIVQSDALENVFEHANEANNTSVDDHPIDVRLSPFPNLQVTSVTPQLNAFSGQQAVVSWVVTNTGTGSTSAPVWYDGVYLNTTPSLNGAVFLGSSANPSYLAPDGDSYHSSRVVTLPQGISGPYYFIIRTDVNNHVFEHLSENDNTLASAPMDVELTPPPDLQVASVQAQQAIAFSGQPVTINWTVSNEGPGGTVQNFWSDRIYLSSDDQLDGGDQLLTTAPRTGALGSLEDYDRSLTVYLPVGISGDYYFIVRTDVFDQVYEHAFEGNNWAATSTPTDVRLTPPPDLVVEWVNPPATVRAGTTLSVSYRVANSGASVTDRSNWTDQLWISTESTFNPATAILVGSRNSGGALHPDQYYERSISGPIANTISGSYYVFVRTDAGHLVFELDRDNNLSAASGPIFIDSRPADLVVSQLHTPPVAESGKSILLDWTVTNQGIGDTIVSSWADRAVLSADSLLGNSDDLTLDTSVRQGLLVSGAAYSVANRLIVIPHSVAPGNYFLFLTTDATNTVYEGGNEGNNATVPAPITISRPTPDLQVTEVFASETADSGAQIQVTWTVRNFGSTPTNATWWYDDIYLSSDPLISTGDLYLGRVQRTNPLDGLAEYTASRSFSLPIDLSGTFYVVVRTDATDRVIEGNQEQNNDRAAGHFSNVSLSPVPDLAVTSVDAPALAYSGQAIEVTWNVSNLGQAGTGSVGWYDAVYLSLDQVLDRSTDISLGFRTRPQGLAPGIDYSQTATFNILRGLSGPFYVFVVADGGGAIYERGAELNNVKLDPFSVQVQLLPPADLVAGTITIPDNAVPGQNVTITYTINNQGTDPASGSWTDSLYLSADEQWHLSDPLIGSVPVNATVAGSGSYTRTLTVPLPGVVPGQYHVIVRTDIRNQIPESNESNNIGASLDQATVDFHVLAPGVPRSGTLGHGQSTYYRVEVPAGETLSVLFDSHAANAFHELYVAYQRVPSRSDFDFASITPFSADQRAVVPTTQAGTYYVLAYGNYVADGPQSYHLTAELVQFSVFDTSYGRGGNAGNLTIEINGTQFDRTVTVTLIGDSGLERPAVAYYREDGERLYATLDLLGLVPGNYDVRVSRSDGATITRQHAIQVVAVASPSAPTLQLQAPDNVRRGAAYQFTAYWGNDSLNDIPTPLLTIGNTAPFHALHAEGTQGTRYSFLASADRGPAGILRPGSSASMTFFTSSDLETPQYTSFIDELGTPASDEFDWAAIELDLRPTTLTDAEWQEVYEHVIERVGQTWDEVLDVARRNAEIKASVGQRRLALKELLWPEVEEALAIGGNSMAGRLVLPSIDISLGRWKVIATNLESGEDYFTETRPDGSFLLRGLAPGTYVLGLQINSSVQSFTTEYMLVAGQAINNIMLEPTAPTTLTMRVFLPNGLPAVGSMASLYLGDVPIAWAMVENDGVATFSGLWEGTYQLVIEGVGFAPHLQVVELEPDVRVDLNAINLGTGAQVTGSVLYSGSLPLSAAVLAVRRDTPGLSPVLGEITNVAITFECLTAGIYDLHIFLDGQSPIVVENVAVPASGVVQLPEIELGNDTGDQVNAGASDSPVVVTSSGPVERLVALFEQLTYLYYSLSMRHHAPTFETFVAKYDAASANGSLGGLPLLSLWFAGRAKMVVMVSAGTLGDPVALAAYKRYFDALGPLDLWTMPLTPGMQDQLRGVAEDTWNRALKVSANAIWSDDRWKDIHCDATVDSKTYSMEELFSLKADPGQFISIGQGQYNPLGGWTPPSSPPYPNSLWDFPARGPLGTVIGGTGEWGLVGSANVSLKIADWRRLDGVVTAELVDSTKVRVSADWTFSVLDAVDFEPGNIYLSLPYLFDVPIFSYLRTLESSGMAWDVPVRFTVPVDIQPVEFHIRRVGDCDPCNGPDPPERCHTTEAPFSFDPNDMLGPDGFGEQQWVTASQPLNYTIRFENDPIVATAPAQVVRITQQLDADLDVRTFRLGQFGFGSVMVQVPANRAFHQDRLDLRAEFGIFVDVAAGVDVATGEAFWEFRSIDPATGDVPINALTGFLPPNLTSPEGEGFVSYSIRAKAGVLTGTVIDAAARIVFDVNEPIDTPPIFNTLDVAPPASQVEALPATITDDTFTVRWTGIDDEGGSGLASFTIFVSTDGGPFVKWLTNATLTEALFVGQQGRTYSFYSIAHDNSGNTESAPSAADAIIGPNVSISGPQVAVRHRPTEFTFVIDRPTVVPPLLEIDWNDGTAVERTYVDAAGDSRLHAFAVDGTRTVRVRLITLDHVVIAESSITIEVVSHLILPNPVDSGLSDIVWGGTNGADHFVVEQPSAHEIRIITLDSAGTPIGEDTFAGVTGEVVIYAGGGDDVIDASALVSTSARLIGGEGNDTLLGGSGNDFIDGDGDGSEGPGNDLIYGGAGNDTIYGDGQEGGSASDMFGRDTIYGGAGDDTIHGDGSEGSSDDLIYADDGNDVVHADGAEGRDSKAALGADTIYGGNGDDLIVADGGEGAADDQFYGEDGNDTLIGGAGDDILSGGDGNDSLSGSTGRDLLVGGLGADTLKGEAGEDLLIADKTTFDLNTAALLAIHAEWTSANSYEDRIVHLTGTAGGANGSNYLIPGTTTFDDEAIDSLTGGLDLDWYVYSLLEDVLNDHEVSEEETDTVELFTP